MNAKTLLQTTALLTHSTAVQRTVARAFHSMARQQVRVSQNYMTVMNVSYTQRVISNMGNIGSAENVFLKQEE